MTNLRKAALIIRYEILLDKIEENSLPWTREETRRYKGQKWRLENAVRAMGRGDDDASADYWLSLAEDHCSRYERL